MSLSSQTQTQIKECEDYDQLVEEILNNDKTIIDFYATWCKPCKKIMPHFEKFNEEYKDVSFIKFDIDNLEDEIREHLNIVKFPTFIFAKKNMSDGKIEKMRYQGSDETVLKENIETYLQLSP